MRSWLNSMRSRLKSIRSGPEAGTIHLNREWTRNDASGNASRDRLQRRTEIGAISAPVMNFARTKPKFALIWRPFAVSHTRPSLPVFRTHTHYILLASSLCIYTKIAKVAKHMALPLGAPLRSSRPWCKSFGGFGIIPPSLIIVIARCAKRAVAIQLDCFVAALLAITAFGYVIS